MKYRIVRIDDNRRKLNGNRLLPSALLDIVGAVDGGIPHFLAHDYLLVNGWAYPLAMHFQGDLACVLGIAETPETDGERAQLIERLRNRLQERSEGEAAASFAELDGKLSPYLRHGARAINQECVARFQPGLATEVFPDLFAKADKEGLIGHRDLDPICPGVFRVGDLAVFAHRFVRRSMYEWNTLNTPLLTRLQRLARTTDFDVRIALDPDTVGLASAYGQVVEHAYWWGPHFDDDLASIPLGVTRHEASDLERHLYSVSAVECFWATRDGLHMLEVEELRDRPTAPQRNDPDTYGCRYLHSVVNEESGEVEHLDGAVRIYTEEQFVGRIGTSIDKDEIGPNVKDVKLWKVNGGLPVSEWKGLVSDFYRGNMLVGEYLGGKDANLLQIEAGEEEAGPGGEAPEAGEPLVHPAHLRVLLFKFPLIKQADGTSLPFHVVGSFSLAPNRSPVNPDSLADAVGAMAHKISEVDTTPVQLIRCGFAWPAGDVLYVLSLFGTPAALASWLASPSAVPPSQSLDDWINLLPEEFVDLAGDSVFLDTCMHDLAESGVLRVDPEDGDQQQ